MNPYKIRPTKDQRGLLHAFIASTGATCLRRAVGCALTNKRGHILATGFNGVASGQPHCNHHDEFDVLGYPHACQGAFAKSGTQLDACEAIHAEQNALLQCRDVWEIETCYCTASPCITCVKLLLNTSCQRIVFIEEYPHPAAKDLWLRAGRTWCQEAMPML